MNYIFESMYLKEQLILTGFVIVWKYIFEKLLSNLNNEQLI